MKSYLVDIYNDFNADLILVQIAILTVAIYTCINLGGLSPIHCRCCPSIVGLVCVGVCYLAGFSIAFLFDFKQSGIHNLLAFLLIGIGVDDMFVITNAID